VDRRCVRDPALRQLLPGPGGARKAPGEYQKQRDEERGHSSLFSGGIDWLRQRGVDIVDLASKECVQLLASFIAAHPELWHEDIGEQ
jgi:hypothetical protein